MDSLITHGRLFRDLEPSAHLLYAMVQYNSKSRFQIAVLTTTTVEVKDLSRETWTKVVESGVLEEYPAILQYNLDAPVADAAAAAASAGFSLNPADNGHCRMQIAQVLIRATQGHSD